MSRLARIARSAKPSTALQFRKHAYGRQNVQDFLRDVLAMANASVEGARYIITGVGFDSKGRKRVYGIDRDDFSGKPAYQALASEHIEPAVRLRYEPAMIDGERVGVFEIGDCQDRPYMMRVDYSETLRRGDAYARINEVPVKLGRRQLQALFEKKFRDSVTAANIEIGFPGEIIHKDRRVRTVDLAELPSAVASAKLRELIAAKERVRESASNTLVARLTHARLFGTDSPYEERSREEIQAEMRQIERRYRNHDCHYLFETHGTELQLVVLNQGDEPIRGASLTLVMPNHSAFHVASELPGLRRDDGFVARTPAEQADYPAVTLRDGSVHVSAQLDGIDPGAPIGVFVTPLRICVGAGLAGRRLGIRYSLMAQNLRAAATGKLRLLFD